MSSNANPILSNAYSSSWSFHPLGSSKSQSWKLCPFPWLLPPSPSCFLPPIPGFDIPLTSSRFVLICSAIRTPTSSRTSQTYPGCQYAKVNSPPRTVVRGLPCNVFFQHSHAHILPCTRPTCSALVSRCPPPTTSPSYLPNCPNVL